MPGRFMIYREIYAISRLTVIIWLGARRSTPYLVLQRWSNFKANANVVAGKYLEWFARSSTEKKLEKEINVACVNVKYTFSTRECA